MKNVFIMILIVFLASCSTFLDANNSAGQQPTINLENQPEIILPYTVQEVESAYEQAKYLNLTPVDPSLENVYYVKIFLTNENMSDTLLQYYIPYTELPMAALEDDPLIKELSKQSGVITYDGYSNVIAVYGIINALHYNHFISNKSIIFVPIKTLNSSEMESIEYDTSFILDMDNQLSNQALGSMGDAYKNSWPVYASDSSQSGMGLNGKKADTSYLGYRPQTDLYIHLWYKERSHFLESLITDPKHLVGIHVNLFRYFHMHYLTTDTGGQCYARVLRGKEYAFRIKMKSHYAKYTGNFTGFAFVYYELRTISDQGLEHMNHVFDDNITSVFGSLYEIYNFAKSEGIDPPRVTFLFKNFADVRDAEAGLFRIRLTNRVHIYKNSIAHEYGHFLHYNYASIFNLPSMWSANTGTEEEKLTYPDGTKDALYYKWQASLLQEGWAEFFALAFQLKTFSNYPTYINNLGLRFLENNYGSKEIIFASESSNTSLQQVIGQHSYNKKYFYSYDFPRFFREASLFYDLWDNNFNMNFYPVNNVYGAHSIAISYPTWPAFANYPWSEYQDRWNWQTNFSFNAVTNHEQLMDRVSVPLSRIFLVVRQHSGDPASPYHQDSPVMIRVSNSASILGISQADLNDVLLLHSPVWPPFNTDTQGPAISISYPSDNSLLATTFNVEGAISDKFSGINASFNRLHYSKSPYTLTNSILTPSGSFIRTLSVPESGTYRVWITAQDNAGNTSIKIINNIQVSFDVPIVYINQPVADFINTNSLSINISGSAAVGTSTIQTVYYSLNDVTNTAVGNTTWSLSAALTDGITNSIKVWARALNGNVSQVVERLVYDDTTVYIARYGNDNNSGTRMAPVMTLQKGVDLASNLGINNVKVAEGVYDEINPPYQGKANCVIVQNGIQLYGGYYNNFTVRDYANHVSVIDGRNLVSSGILKLKGNNVIDGFQIKNGDEGYHSEGSSSIVRNNIFTYISGTRNAEYDTAIFVSTDTISNNTFQNISAQYVMKIPYPRFIKLNHNIFIGITNYVIRHHLNAGLEELKNNHFIDCPYLLDGWYYPYPSGEPIHHLVGFIAQLNSVDESLGRTSDNYQGNW